MEAKTENFLFVFIIYMQNGFIQLINKFLIMRCFRPLIYSTSFLEYNDQVCLLKKNTFGEQTVLSMEIDWRGMEELFFRGEV